MYESRRSKKGSSKEIDDAGKYIQFNVLKKPPLLTSKIRLKPQTKITA